MVEPVMTITAVSLLAMYLKGATEEAGKRTTAALDEGARGGLRKLYDLVKRRLSRESKGQEALAAVERAPEDPDKREDLQKVLDAVTTLDDDFAKELAAAVADVREQAGDSIQIDNSGAVALHGNVILRGKYVAGRDMTISPDAS